MLSGQNTAVYQDIFKLNCESLFLKSYIRALKSKEKGSDINSL